MKGCRCAICGISKDVELSHDIPKYIGGDDRYRTFLCIKHHREYDLKLLLKFLDYLGEELKDDSEIPYWQSVIKKNESMHKKLQSFAKELASKYFIQYKKVTYTPRLYCRGCGHEVDIEDNYCKCSAVLNKGDYDDRHQGLVR